VEASFTKTELRMSDGRGAIMKRTATFVAFALALGLLSQIASAQTTPAATPSANEAAMAAQKAAFLALPDATRNAAQGALVWLGLYVGVNDGDFGEHTRDAIPAFQRASKRPPMARCRHPSSRPCSPPLKTPARRPDSKS
jgi:Putative peptidoglycan binding domain